MRRKLIFVVVTMALAAMLAGGATYAVFTDQAVNGPNTFTAGKVDIEAARNSSEPVPGPMFYTTLEEGMGADWQTNYNQPKYPTGLWKPGDSHQRDMTVSNYSSMPVKLARVGAQITGDSAFMADDDAVAELSQYMTVKIEASNGSTSTTMWEGLLGDLLASEGQEAVYQPTMGEKVGDNIPTQHLKWTCSLGAEAGNPLQGKKPVLSFYIVAEQIAHNP